MLGLDGIYLMLETVLRIELNSSGLQSEAQPLYQTVLCIVAETSTTVNLFGGPTQNRTVD